MGSTPSTSSPPPSSTAQPTGTPALRLWGLLLVLAGNMLIDALEVSVMVVALPSIGTDLDLPLTSAQWMITGFAIGFGGLMLFGGRVVALLGRREVYLTALLGFAAASVAAALTDDIRLLVATRVVKGLCAALTAPTGLAIIQTTYPAGRPRDRALSVYTLFGASGFTAGLLLSGTLTPIDWRLTLAFPAPVVLALFLLGHRLIPRTPPETGRHDAAGTPRRYDTAGAATCTAALLTLVAGITSAPAHGWTSPRTTALLAASALLLTAFVTIERRTPQPLMRFTLLGNGPLARSILGAAALNGSYLGLLFVLTYELQTLDGWHPFTTALALLPAAAPLAATALLSGRMIAAFGTARLIAAGSAFPLAGYLWQLRRPWPLDYTTAVLPTMLLVGTGFVLSFAALNTQATAQLPPQHRAQGAGLYQSAVQAAAALVPALAAALLTAHRPPAGAPASEFLTACRPALVLVTLIGALGLLTALAGLRPRRG
ncbi:MFS transporter [Kitasatospora sp. NPDC058444]|uniref:MFS transporter n=1 Tax=Kitasatospora sp. NPDC058444 TaxID=3346504 RepID=UPI00364DE3E5